jgi:lysophospholipase L1-like esterase
MRATFAALAATSLLCVLTGCGAGPGGAPVEPVDLSNANIAFMGDSITRYWTLPTTNLGVVGNATANMLARFPSEVLGHGYKAVVILGGTNDIRFVDYTVNEEVDKAASNLKAMAADAQKAGILVVLCNIPPIQVPYLNERVPPLNAAITKLAKENNYRLVDYYTPMVGHPEYFEDTLHPNAEGYAVMQKALSDVLPLDY